MDKASLRARMRGLGPIPPEMSARIVDGLFGWLSRLPGTISAFLPMEGESICNHSSTGSRAGAGCCPGSKKTARSPSGISPLPTETHPFGMEQPTASGPMIPIPEIDVFLVPGRASICAVAGWAMGLGTTTASCPRLGATPSASGLHRGNGSSTSVPVEAHDVLVGWLATEDGVISRAPNG